MADNTQHNSHAEDTLLMDTKRIVLLFGIWLILSLFCNDLTNYGNIPLGLNVRVDRIAIIVLLVSFLKNRSGQRTRVPSNKVELGMLWFFLISFGSCILFGAINAANHRYISNLVNFAVIPAVLFAIARRLTFDEKALLLLMRFFQIVGLYLGVTGILEHFQVISLIFPKYIMDPTVGLHYGRARGPFGNAAVMGGALTLIFFWILWYQTHVKKSLLNLMLLLTTFVSLYFTDTRSAWLLFFTSLLVLTLFSKIVRKACCVAGVLLLVIYCSGIFSKFSAYQPTLFSRREGPVEDRMNIMEISLAMFRDRPLLGFGYGNYELSNDPYFERSSVPLRGNGEGQHNTILGLLVELGIIGTLPYLYIYGFFIRSALKQSRTRDGRNPVGREMAATQLALLLGIVVYMQFSDVRFFNVVNEIVFWMSGVVCSAGKGVLAQETVRFEAA